LHISEMGWSRVADASHVVKPGDEITVTVLRVDDDKQKISLGLKQLTPDPWSRIEDRYAVGQVVSGRVTRVAQFGAFVELEPGIEALAHASTFTPAGSQSWTTVAPVGTTATFEIQTIDLAKKRIGVALVAEGERQEYAAPDDTAAAKPIGSLADQLRNALGTKQS